MSAPRLGQKYAGVLFFLIDFQTENRYAPTVSEIARHFKMGWGAALGCVLKLEKKIISKSCGMHMVVSAGSM